MKKIIIAFTLVGALFITSCDKDQLVYEGSAVGLVSPGSTVQISVPTTGSTETFPVIVTSTSSEARTFALEFVGDAPAAGGVSLGTVTVPADSYDGTASINFDFDSITLADGITDTFVFRTSSDTIEVINTQVTIEYFKAIICNDATLTFITDFWAEETGFSITEDATGSVIYSFAQGDLAQGEQTIMQDIFLADGCYTAVTTDQFGDGQSSDGGSGSTVATGGWSIDCSILTFATGGGANIGSSQTVNFCVGQ